MKLDDVVPVLWNALHMAECERIRTLNRVGFNRIMDKNEMALTKRVRDRIWSSFETHGLAVPSPYSYGALDFDTVKIRNYILDNGLEDEVYSLGLYEPESIHTYTHDTHIASTQGGVQ